jgi:phosphoribosyl 1,2-cyclic phosphodiesterase
MKPAFSWCSLASGSSGNALLVRGPTGSILIDMGLSLRECAKRLHSVDAGLEEIRALVLTHAHSDHTKGAGILARRLGIPVYLSQGCSKSTPKIWRGDELRIEISARESFHVAGFQVSALGVSHDTSEPLQFRIEAAGQVLVVLTDLGRWDASTEAFLQGANGLQLEFNHDVERLKSGPYPWHLKKRVLSDHGHLSNDQAAEVLVKVATTKLRQLSLAHLSQENNRPELALAAAQQALISAGVQADFVGCAKPYEAGPWHVLTAQEKIQAL